GKRLAVDLDANGKHGDVVIIDVRLRQIAGGVHDESDTHGRSLSDEAASCVVLILANAFGHPNANFSYEIFLGAWADQRHAGVNATRDRWPRRIRPPAPLAGVLRVQCRA